MASNKAVAVNFEGEGAPVTFTDCVLNVSSGGQGQAPSVEIIQDVGRRLCEVVNANTRRAIHTQIHEPFDLEEPKTTFTPALDDTNFYCRRKRDLFKINSLDDVFKGYELFGHISLIGPPGSGKTTLSKRFAQRVLDKKVPGLEHIEMVQFIRAGALNENTPLTPFDFLINQPLGSALDETMRQHGPAWFRSNHEKVLFIVDGLDQRNWKYDSTNMADNSSAGGETILSNLFRRVLYEGCKILTTARNYCLSDLQKDARPDRVVSVGKLDPESVDLLITELGGEDGHRILNHLKTECPSLLLHCGSPLMLLFITAILKATFQERNTANCRFPLSGPGSPIVTASELFVCVIEYFNNSRHSLDDYLDVLSKLKKLSYRYARYERYFFTLKDIEELNLTKADVKDIMAVELARDQDHDKIRDDSIVLYFMHQLIQETLAALYLGEASMEEFSENVEFIVRFSHGSEIGKILVGMFCHSATRRRAEKLCRNGLTHFQEKKQLIMKHLKETVCYLFDKEVQILSELDKEERDEIQPHIKFIQCQDVHPSLLAFDEKFMNIQPSFTKFSVTKAEQINRFLHVFDKVHYQVWSVSILVNVEETIISSLVTLLRKGNIGGLLLKGAHGFSTEDIEEIVDLILEKSVKLQKIKLHVDQGTKESLSLIVAQLARLWHESSSLREAQVYHNSSIAAISYLEEYTMKQNVVMRVLLTSDAHDCIAKLLQERTNPTRICGRDCHLTIPFSNELSEIHSLHNALQNYGVKVQILTLDDASSYRDEPLNIEDEEGLIGSEYLGEILQDVYKFKILCDLRQKQRINKDNWVQLARYLEIPSRGDVGKRQNVRISLNGVQMDSDSFYHAGLFANMFEAKSINLAMEPFGSLDFQSFIHGVDDGPKSTSIQDLNIAFEPLDLMTSDTIDFSLLVHPTRLMAKETLSKFIFTGYGKLCALRMCNKYHRSVDVWTADEYEFLSDLIVTQNVIELFVGNVQLSSEGLEILERKFRSHKKQLFQIRFSQCSQNGPKEFSALCSLGCAANAQYVGSFPCSKVEKISTGQWDGQIQELNITNSGPLTQRSNRNLGLLIASSKVKALRTQNILLGALPFQHEMVAVKAMVHGFMEYGFGENLSKLLENVEKIHELCITMAISFRSPHSAEDTKECKKLLLQSIFDIVRKKEAEKLTLLHFGSFGDFVEYASFYSIQQKIQLSSFNWNSNIDELSRAREKIEKAKILELADVFQCRQISVNRESYYISYENGTIFSHYQCNPGMKIKSTDEAEKACFVTYVGDHTAIVNKEGDIVKELFPISPGYELDESEISLADNLMLRDYSILAKVLPNFQDALRKRARPLKCYSACYTILTSSLWCLKELELLYEMRESLLVKIDCLSVVIPLPLPPLDQTSPVKKYEGVLPSYGRVIIFLRGELPESVEESVYHDEVFERILRMLGLLLPFCEVDRMDIVGCRNGEYHNKLAKCAEAHSVQINTQEMIYWSDQIPIRRREFQHTHDLFYPVASTGGRRKTPRNRTLCLRDLFQQSWMPDCATLCLEPNSAGEPDISYYSNKKVSLHLYSSWCTGHKRAALIKRLFLQANIVHLTLFHVYDYEPNTDAFNQVYECFKNYQKQVTSVTFMGNCDIPSKHSSCIQFDNSPGEKVRFRDCEFFKLGRILGSLHITSVVLKHCNFEQLQQLNDGLGHRPNQITHLSIQIEMENIVVLFFNLAEILEKCKVETLAIEGQSWFSFWEHNHINPVDLFNVHSLKAFTEALRRLNVKLRSITLDVVGHRLWEDLECFWHLGRLVEVTEATEICVNGPAIGKIQKAVMNMAMDKMKDKVELL